MKEKDLFNQPQTIDKKIRKRTNILLPRLRKCITLSYENAIFLAIGFVMSCIIFFSLGVEKGKREVNNIEKQTNYGAVENHARDSGLVKKTVKGNSYIIQLATFRKIGAAEQEQDKLRKEGYVADIRKAGDYYQVYIAGFDTRMKAESSLIKFKKEYKDCYIKKD